MKKNNSIIAILLIVLLLPQVSLMSGCSCGESKKSSIGFVNKVESAVQSSEDVKNLVTDDDRLVINYYNAYTWMVYFNDLGHIECMTYIYEFEDSDEAEVMCETREEELSKNKSMTVHSSWAVDEYVIVVLSDTSFTNVTRTMLEHNFSGLIVY